MRIATGLLAIMMSAVVAPHAAHADVKAGVDAWTQGDYDRAITEWRPMAVSGDPDAQFNMGQAYKLGRGVPVDLTTALDWFRRAYEQGHQRAADNYGLLLFQQGKQAEAMPFIRTSSEQGEPRAQYILATALFNGDLVQQDWVRSYALMTRASASGLAQASESLKLLEDYIPADQRQKGLALAATMSNPGTAQVASTAPPVRTAAAAKPAPAARSTPTPKPIPVAAPPAPAPVPTATNVQTGPIAPPPIFTQPTSQILADQQKSTIAPTAFPAPAPAPVHSAPPVREAAVAAPPPPAAKPAPAVKPAPSGRWRVQIGAFGEAGRAQALWQRLSSRVADLGALQPFYVAGGGVTRLQIGPLASAADAARICTQIKAAGSDCIPKAP